MPRVPTIRVEVSPAYDVVVEPGLLCRIADYLKPLAKSPTAAVVMDSNIVASHGVQLLLALSDVSERVIECTFPAGEENKNLQAVQQLYSRILSHRIDRQSPVLALGGGVVGDTAGFVAATILRGVPFVQIPTTLLSMVDASVGGKTGIDHPAGKNLIGAFHQPAIVLIDPRVLSTLPLAELQNGLAECIKHQIIRDAPGFDALEKNIGRAIAMDIDYLCELVAHNVAIKAKVVAADPLEKGERAHLNFGHTFGHAIETVSGYSYSHGQSVALGMCAAAYVSARLNLLDDASRQRIVHLIAAAGLPVGKLKLDVSKIIDAMSFDKKVVSGRLRFVLIDRIGHAIIRDDVPPEMVREALLSLQD
jgi:3-dehydroquinate synthase